MEKWSDIDGFPGYQVSSHGNVRSRKNNRGGISSGSWHTLKPRVNPNGYLVVTLHDEGRIPHQMAVHRLVAKTFIPTDDGTLVVDHLDANKQNNHVRNLEWVTCKENSIRACRAGLYDPAFEKTMKPVVATDTRTGEELYFEGVNEAARYFGCSPSFVSRVAHAERNQLRHYVIEFANRDDRLLYPKNYI